MNKYYSGIGSRDTPPHIINQMIELAQIAAQHEWTLNSGGADGADRAFEMGCDLVKGQKQIYLPWENFNNNGSNLIILNDNQYKIASAIHPRWDILRPRAKNLMARNVCQVLGSDLKTPVKCVICWTPDGCETFEKYGKSTGGTGMAIALASINNIPVFNLKLNLRYEESIDFLLNN